MGRVKHLRPYIVTLSMVFPKGSTAIRSSPVISPGTTVALKNRKVFLVFHSSGHLMPPSLMNAMLISPQMLNSAMESVQILLKWIKNEPNRETCDDISKVAFRVVSPGLKQDLRPANRRIIVGQKLPVLFKLRFDPRVLREYIINEEDISPGDAHSSHRSQQLSSTVEVEPQVSEILGVLVHLNIFSSLGLGAEVVKITWRTGTTLPVDGWVT